MDVDEPGFLLSVVETIADGNSTHPRLDAYATFVNRVRSQRHILDTSVTPLPALAPLRDHKDNFIRALRRDIRLAHSDPLVPSSLDDTAFHIDVRQYASDASSLCHHALCTLTTIFRFPAFYFVFSGHDLSALFGDVLDIALADSLPVLSEAKTYSLSLWALGCHRLPLAALASRQDDLFSALRQSLDSARRPGNVVLDGLKAVSHTIECHPSAFLELLFPLLPHVITNLDCKSLGHHLHASIVLGKFANALIHQSELSLAKWQQLSNHVISFLESRSDEFQEAPRTTSLLCMVRKALSAQFHTRPTDAARVLAVLASLIVLCGPSLYSKPVVLQVILQSLAMSLTHKRAIIRAMHPHVWRCFVWTFSQMLSSSENVEPALISAAFYVIKQEVSGGIGVALASVLLSDRAPATRSDERADKISRTLSVIKAMVRTECENTRRDGFMFLHAVTNGTDARRRILQNMYEIPASVLLDGTIVRAEWDSLPSVVHSVPKIPVSLCWPEEIEIAPHCKTLLVIWKHLASKGDRTLWHEGLVDVWMSILLACSHHLEHGKHDRTPAEMLRYTTEIIIEFLPTVTSEDRQLDWGSWDIQDQLCSLTFIDQLWSAMQRAFAVLSLAEAAELILTSILKYAFHVLDPSIQMLWGRLCANLMTTAPPSFLRDTPIHTTSQLAIRSQRELWGVVARSLSSSELGLDWRQFVKFLAIPVCTWVLSEPELKAWETLFQNVIAISEDSAVVIDHIVLQYFQGKGVETWDSIIPILGFFLTCARKHGSSPTDRSLSTVDACLTVCYGRARHSPEVLTRSLRLLNAIRQEITSAPGNVMQVLRALCNSLCLWIEDRGEVMSDDEFNSVAVTLYCEALKALKVLPLSLQSLQDTENFLASAFSRIPTPAMAPFAFEDFWRATYHGQSQFSSLPPKIKSCLSCFVAAYGGDLADGLPLATDSQSQSISKGSQVRSPIGHQQQDIGEFGFGVNQSPVPTNAEAWTEMKIALRKEQRKFAGQEDTTFPLPSPDDDVPRPTVQRQLREYTSRIDASSQDCRERSMFSPRTLSFSPSELMPSSPSPPKVKSVASYTSSHKRRLAESGDTPRKRSRACRSALRTIRQSESEPATRDVTPVEVSRMNSVPLKKKKVFDGIELPTFREISRRKTVQKAETGNNAIDTGRGIVAVSQTPPLCHTHGKSRASQPASSPSVGSDEDDDLDWENFCINGASSEADVDRSLGRAHSSSPPGTWISAIHDPRGLPSTSSPPKAVLESDAFPLIQRVKITSRLDALQDVYSSVANGASQIPWPELVQATKLVHQIGAVLTEQMGKKMRDPR